MDENINEEHIDFVQNASSKSRNIGHNKFQLQLQEANSTIVSLNEKISEQNAELELFKNNMKTLQIQLQGKTTDIAILNGQLADLTNRFNKVNTEFEMYKQNSQDFTYEIDNDKSKLLFENAELSANMESLKTTLENTNVKYEELKNKYQLTLTLLDSKTNAYKDLSTNYDNTVNEMNLYKELNQKQLSSIDLLKEELEACRNENSILRTRIFEKDAYLGELNKKYALQQQSLRGKKNTSVFKNTEEEVLDEIIEEHSTQEEEQINDNIDLNVVNITSRPVKVAGQRQLKVSRR